MYVHYISLGSHDKHLYEPFKKYPCKKVVFIYSEDYDPFLEKDEIKRIRSNIRNAKKICKTLGLDCEFLKLKGKEFYENIYLIRSKISEEKDKVIVNITGSRKILSLALLISAMDCKNIEKMIYVYDDEILYIPKNFRKTDLEKKILRSLSKGDKRVMDLAEEFKVKKSLISRYIKNLEDKGFVVIYRKGKEKFVRRII